MQPNILKLARFIERHGGTVIFMIGVVILLFSAWVFYFYGWRAVNLTPEPIFQIVELKQDKLEKVLSDLKDRQAKSRDVELPPVGNIFR